MRASVNRFLEKNLVKLCYFEKPVEPHVFKEPPYMRRVAELISAGNPVVYSGNGLMVTTDGFILTPGHVATSLLFDTIDDGKKGMDVNRMAFAVSEGGAFPLVYFASDKETGSGEEEGVYNLRYDLYEFITGLDDSGLIKCDVPADNPRPTGVKFSKKKTEKGDRVAVIGYENSDTQNFVRGSFLFKKETFVSEPSYRRPARDFYGGAPPMFEYFTLNLESERGNSGSVVVNDGGEIVGMLIGGFTEQSEKMRGSICLGAEDIEKFLLKALRDLAKD